MIFQASSTQPVPVWRARASAHVAAVFLTVVFSAMPGLARDVAVADAAALEQALQAAQPGDRLLLAGGAYGKLGLWSEGKVDPRFDGPVTVQSASPKQPAVFSGLKLTGARNLIFRQVVFDYRAASGSKYWSRPFRIDQSSDITISGSLFDGDDAHGSGPPDDGYGTGIGVSVGGSSRVTIEGNVIRNFHIGLAMGGGNGNVVRGNDLSGMRVDAMTFVTVRDLLIENNHIHDFRRNPDAGDHSDMIQFWTINKKTPSTGITIRGNVLNMGDGDHTQSIFMRNEAVDSQNGGPTMFYRDVVIEENVIINSHLHGITIGETDGLTIRRNTLIRVPRKGVVSYTRGPENMAPRIRVAKAAVNVTIRDNIAAGIPAPSAGWDVADNLIIQDMGRMILNYYTLVFENGLVGPPYPLAAFTYRAGGPADRAGLGASRLAAH